MNDPPTLAEACAALAAAVGTVTAPGITVTATAHPPTGSDRRTGQAWVTVAPVRPSAFGGVCEADLTAVVVLSADPVRATELYNALAVQVVNAVTAIDGLPVHSVSTTPEALPAVGDPSAFVYVLTITATAEVS